MRCIRQIVWVGLTLLLFLAAAEADAVEIAGRVTNRTSGRPVAGQEVTLLALRGGMVALDSRDTDSNGRVRFVVAANPNENFLVRVAYRGVNYHQPAAPIGGDRIEVNVDVYDTTTSPAGIEHEAHHLFLDAHTGHVRITEVVLFNNRTEPPQSYVPERSSDSLLGFLVPADATEDVRAFVAGPGGMPLRQQPQPGEEPNTYTLDYPLRPGTTQIEFSYAVPLQNNAYEFSRRWDRGTPAPRIVTPLEGIRLSGPSISGVQDEPGRRARIYSSQLARGNQLRFRIEVEPSAVAARAADEPAQSEAAPAPSGNVTLIPNPVAESKWYIVGLTLVVLALGLYYLYLLPSAGTTPNESQSRPEKHR